MPEPRPPRHLRTAGKALYAAVTAEWTFGAAELAVLVRAAEAADRAEDARLLVEREGLVIGTRAHPAINVERDSRALMARLLGSIGVLNPSKSTTTPDRSRPGPKPSRTR